VASSQKPTSADAVAETGDQSIKETLVALVVAFIFAFIFRAYVVEAFVIPTGSMAPTLLGEHLRVVCPECGHGFPVGVRSESSFRVEPGAIEGQTWVRPWVTDNSLVEAVCPMCHFPYRPAERERLSAGDRILVLKYIYSLSEPRRWDVVVFKSPEKPHTNFIKRLVGLPRERLLILDGNIHTQPTDAFGAASGEWSIARKVDHPTDDVQPAVWQPIYHSRFVPLDGGANRYDHPWSTPWRAVLAPGRIGDALPFRPAQADETEQGWEIDNRRAYRYTGEAAAAIAFDFELAAEGGPISSWYAYNQLHHTQSVTPREPIEDVRVAATFLPDREGLAVELTTTARLDAASGEPQRLWARVDADGLLTLEVEPLHAVNRAAAARRVVADPARLAPFRPGVHRRIELWHVDQHVRVIVDGDTALTWNYDLPMEQLLRREPIAMPPSIGIRVAGSPVTLSRVQVDRDIYYSTNQSSKTARGAVQRIRTADDRVVYDLDAQPVTIGSDQFFCMGDNSPLSDDSRYWDAVDPWVQVRANPGGPGPDPGLVPRSLMIGRAFFVYFPAPIALQPRGRPFIPDFGRMRFID